MTNYHPSVIPPAIVARSKQACRCCGGLAVPTSGSSTFGRVCGHCWHSYERWESNWANGEERTENLFNSWLARQAFLQARRIDTYGTAVRCEAISGANNVRTAGCQCGRLATERRDGRWVCASHTKAIAPIFIDTPQADPFQVLIDILRQIRNGNAEFRKAFDDAFLKAQTGEQQHE